MTARPTPPASRLASAARSVRAARLARGPRCAALAALALCAPLAACGSSPAGPSGGTASSAAPAAAAPQRVTDGTGTPVDLPARASKVVCLTAICDDALVELGLRPAASTNAGPSGLLADARFLGRDAASVPAVEGAFGEENVEQVAQAEPDLVIGLAGAHDKLRGTVSASAPLYLASISSYRDSEAFLRMMGRATGRTQQAEAAVARFEKTLADAQARAQGKGATTLAMFGSDTDFGVDTRSSVLGSVLGTLGGYPWETPAGQKGGHSQGQGTYSLEQIKRTDPDVLFVQTFSFGPTASTPLSKQLAANPVWGTMKAVRAGRVVEVPTAIWAQGRGTRSLGIVATTAAEQIAQA